MAKKGLEAFETDVLAWLVWHWKEHPEDEAESEQVHPGWAEEVRAEFATRPQVLPRHLRRK